VHFIVYSGISLLRAFISFRNDYISSNSLSEATSIIWSSSSPRF